MSTELAPQSKVFIWDLGVRLFHALLILVFLVAFGSGEWDWQAFGLEPMQLHFYAGYALAGLLTFRMLWGFVGGRHARFWDFLPWPRQLLDEVKAIAGQRQPPHRGHGALGGLATLTLLGLLSVQVISGLLNTDEITMEGPFAKLAGSKWVELAHDVHEVNTQLLLAMILLHVLAIGFHTLVRKDALIAAMVTGSKSIAGGEELPGTRRHWGWLVLSVLLSTAVCGGAIYWALQQPGSVLYGY
jgi:cytochrome b